MVFVKFEYPHLFGALSVGAAGMDASCAIAGALRGIQAVLCGQGCVRDVVPF